jgi:hypothetical protein
MDMRASPRRHEFNIKKALKLIVFEWLHIRKLQPPALSAHHVDDKLTEALVRLQLPKLQQLGGYTIDAGWISWGPRPRPYEPVRELISSRLHWHMPIALAWRVHSSSQRRIVKPQSQPSL